MKTPTVPAHREPFTLVNPNAAGFDIGKDEIWTCVPADRDPDPRAQVRNVHAGSGTAR